MPGIIDEYMLKLGCVVDQSGMARFQQALHEAGAATDTTAFGMAKSMFKAQTEIVSGFVAIGAAALGLVDKVAMADQEYRLFALHMYMSKDAARSLKVAMDALGQPLENLMWDPELQQRATQLIKDQRAMAPDGDFDAQMRKIRDVRFEFTRMEVELQYMGMHVVQDFMKALGLGPDTLLKKLQVFNAWVIKDMPEISRKIVTYFLPIWHDVVDVLRATGEAIKDAAVLFTNLVGLFSGDSSIEGTALNFDKMAKAVYHVSGGFSEFAMLIAHTEELLLHFVNALTLLADRKFKEAGAELKLAGSSISTKEGMELLGGGFGFLSAGPWGAMAGAGAMHEFGSAMERSTGTGKVSPEYTQAMTAGAAQVAQQASVQLGIPADLLWSQMAFETGGFKQFAGQNNLAGIKDPTTGKFQNFDTLSEFLSKYTDTLSLSRYAGIKGARTPEEFTNYLAKGHYFGNDSASNYLAGVKRYDKDYTSGNFNAGGVTINITQQPGQSHEQLADAVVKRLRAEDGKRIQRNQQLNAQYSSSY